MRRKILFSSAFFWSVIVSSVALTQEVKPPNIDSVKAQQADLPSGFVLYEQSVSKPGPSPGERDYQCWRRQSAEEDLALVEETKDTLDDPVGAFVRQIWYRGETKGERDKIEVEIVISPTPEQVEQTVTSYTTKMFPTPFKVTESPLAGDKSWLPVDLSEGTFSVMFSRQNVFVRLHLALHNAAEAELLEAGKRLAGTIDGRVRF